MRKYLLPVVVGLSWVLAGLACALPLAAAPAATKAPEVTPPAATLPPPDALPSQPPITPIHTPDLTATHPASDATATPDLAGMRVFVFLIALEDGGKSGPAVGCGDSVVPVAVMLPRTEGVLRAALEKLLSMKDQFLGESGLYNALYQSDLRVDGVRIEDGKAVIELSGTLQQGGECDSPRIQAQLEQTALQFSTVKSTAIFINGKPLEDVLSLRGE